MKSKLLFFILWMAFTVKCNAQTDTTEVAMDSIVIDSVVVISDNIITNTSAIQAVFEKLYALEQGDSSHVNIVHIGDSHIQADLFTAEIRRNLQERFGNAGCGFSFPHNLANTNGSYYVRYKSNISWESRRNIYPPDGTPVGLSGIGLTAKEDFVLELETRDEAYNFNTLKIITPQNRPLFDVATSSKTIVLESSVPKTITHRIKSGEALSIIAEKYGITVSQIKKVNGLRSNNIRAGKTLKIPTGQKEKRQVSRSEFIPLALSHDSLSNFYYSKEPLSKIYLLPAREAKEYSLNGLILEKDVPGILYHSIGVNGAKCSDYNKYPLFFEQLPTLKPDLIVISLGTNESFDKMPVADYMVQLNLFIESIRTNNPDAAILVTTPPPSLFKRKYPNTFVGDYSKKILIQETEKNYASWDMFTVLGGLFSVKENAEKGLMSTDRIHYSRQGYEHQGKLFTEAFLNAYNNFKTNR